MKKTKKFSIILILTLILPIFGSAKTIDKNPINNYVEFCRYDVGELSSTDTKDYIVIVAYDEKDKENIFDGLTDKERDEFLGNKTKEIFEYISKGENEKIEKMKIDNPKLSIIIQKKDVNKYSNFIENNTLCSQDYKLKTNDLTPYSYDTDTFVSNKYFRVSNDSGLAYADCLAEVRVDRDLINREVTIVGIDVSILRGSGKFAFNPTYNGNNTARLGWGYIGSDGYGYGHIDFKAHFNKTVDMF